MGSYPLSKRHDISQHWFHLNEFIVPVLEPQFDFSWHANSKYLVGKVKKVFVVIINLLTTAILPEQMKTFKEYKRWVLTIDLFSNTLAYLISVQVRRRVLGTFLVQPVPGTAMRLVSTLLSSNRVRSNQWSGITFHSFLKIDSIFKITKASKIIKGNFIIVLTKYLCSSYLDTYLIFLCHLPEFYCICSDGTKSSSFQQINYSRLGLKSFLHNFFPGLMFTRDVNSSVLILWLSRTCCSNYF